MATTVFNSITINIERHDTGQLMNDLSKMCYEYEQITIGDLAKMLAEKAPVQVISFEAENVGPDKHIQVFKCTIAG